MAASNKGPKKRTKQLNISTIISGDGRPIRLGRLQEGDRMSNTIPGSPVDTQPDSGDERNVDGECEYKIVMDHWSGVVLLKITLRPTPTTSSCSLYIWRYF